MSPPDGPTGLQEALIPNSPRRPLWLILVVVVVFLPNYHPPPPVSSSSPFHVLFILIFFLRRRPNGNTFNARSHLGHKLVSACSGIAIEDSLACPQRPKDWAKYIARVASGNRTQRGANHGGRIKTLFPKNGESRRRGACLTSGARGAGKAAGARRGTAMQHSAATIWSEWTSYKMQVRRRRTKEPNKTALSIRKNETTAAHLHEAAWVTASREEPGRMNTPYFVRPGSRPQEEGREGQHDPKRENTERAQAHALRW